MVPVGSASCGPGIPRALECTWAPSGGQGAGTPWRTRERLGLRALGLPQPETEKAGTGPAAAEPTQPHTSGWKDHPRVGSSLCPVGCIPNPVGAFLQHPASCPPSSLAGLPRPWGPGALSTLLEGGAVSTHRADAQSNPREATRPAGVGLRGNAGQRALCLGSSPVAPRVPRRTRSCPGASPHHLPGMGDRVQTCSHPSPLRRLGKW